MQGMPYIVAKWNHKRMLDALGLVNLDRAQTHIEMNDAGQFATASGDFVAYGTHYSPAVWDYLDSTEPEWGLVEWEAFWPRAAAATRGLGKAGYPAPVPAPSPRPDVCAWAEMKPLAHTSAGQFSARAWESAKAQFIEESRRSALRTMREYPICKWGHAVQFVGKQEGAELAAGFLCSHCAESLSAWERSK